MMQEIDPILLENQELLTKNHELKKLLTALAVNASACCKLWLRYIESVLMPGEEGVADKKEGERAFRNFHKWLPDLIALSCLTERLLYGPRVEMDEKQLDKMLDQAKEFEEEFLQTWNESIHEEFRLPTTNKMREGLLHKLDGCSDCTPAGHGNLAELLNMIEEAIRKNHDDPTKH